MKGPRGRLAPVAWALVLAVASACTNDDDTTTPAAASETSAASPSTTAAAAYAPPHEFEVSTRTLVDSARTTVDATGVRLASERTLITDVYVPDGEGPFPLVVFAHGASGHPRKFTELFEAWARAGFVVAAPAFPLTNDTAPVVALGDVVNQPADLSFVISEVLSTVGVADEERVGLGGLSLGGVTVYAATFHSCCRDERVDAAIVMAGTRLDYEGEYRFDGVPLLVMHGTADPVVPLAAAEAAYAEAAPPKYFVRLAGAFHAEAFENTESPHDRTVVAVTADFWRAYLAGDAAALERMDRDAEAGGVASIESVR